MPKNKIDLKKVPQHTKYAITGKISDKAEKRKKKIK